MREILLVGSVPLRPAEAVFETISRELDGLVPRMTDGDQHGWILAAVKSFAENEALEPTGSVELSVGGAQVPTFGLRPGHSASELRLGPYGYAEVAAKSYGTFRDLRDRGTIPPTTRFQVTLPGPGTSAYMIHVEAEPLLDAASRALADEISRLVDLVPAHDLTVQLDLAMEAEHEEYLRRPEAFATPVHETFDWTLEQMAAAAAAVAEAVPAEAELGFHICSIWHHYQPGGQDNAVLVDTANALARQVGRRIDYVHIPTIPEHDVDDFAPLADLRLDPATTVYLGVIHRADGLDGARRRIAAAQRALPEFGIASFCGLGNPAMKEATHLGDALHEDLRSGDSTLIEVLALHREVAELVVS